MRKVLPLLMTASVSTRGMIGADFSDEERETMYVTTLQYYIEHVLKGHPERKIVFAENSGWDKDRILKRISGGGVIEYISLNPGHFDISRGKGYNELILINEAIEKSKFISEAGAFIKVTGRYPIYNIAYFIDSASRFIYEKGGVFYGDMKDHRLYDWMRLGWCGHAGYAVLFASTIENYRKNIGSKYETLNDQEGSLLEGLLYDYMAPFRKSRSAGVLCRFKREPICGGLQGSNMAAASFSKSNDSLKSRIMRFVGNCIRTFTPWFWF